MRVQWKALIGYGFLFWVILCLSDLLGFTKIQSYSDLDELYSRPLGKTLHELRAHEEREGQNQEHRGLKFGWALIVLNSLTFIFSIIICSFIRAAIWTTFKMFNSRRQPIVEIKRVTSFERSVSNTTVSKIPIMVKSPSATIRSSETDLSIRGNISSEKSCPNLLAMRRTASNLSTKTTGHCETLFKNDNMFSATINLCNTNKDTDYQCKKLKEELVKLQANSLKEHALLSRKLDAIIKEKKDISKQLTLAQKENRAAKQQLEELLQEKSVLVKRLENATKEFKCNTKTKKYALAKLEEVTANVEQLRLQLEQVSRDKEILQKKLRLLEHEYSKLHSRYLNSQNEQDGDGAPESTPERDEAMSDGKEHAVDAARRESSSSGNMDFTTNNIPNNTVGLIASVSQTELDMKKIQMKIKQLEKNLENFSMNADTYKSPEESEISTSAGGNTDGSFTRLSEDVAGYQSDIGYSGNNSPRSKFWINKSAEIFGKHEQYAKIQAMANKMHEKVQFLGNIKERSEETLDDESTDAEDFSSTSEIREPTRIVSSSLAFKNFLKSLNQAETARRSINVLGEFYF